MPFEDLYVFQESPPDELFDDRRGDRPDYAGHRVVYRLGLQSMEIAGMPERLRVGRVTVHQTTGPVRTQRTEVVQQVGVPLVFHKVMRTGIPAGDGLPLSVCEIEDTLPEDDLDLQFERWRDEALSALGLLAVLLDERIAQEVVFEDAVLFAKSGDRLGAIDVRRAIRNFMPYPVLSEAVSELEQLATAQLEGSLAAAARWYLRAAQGGPRADGIVYLWTAIEALLGPANGSKADQLNEALRGAGAVPESMPISPSRLSWIRGEVVHRGKEQPDGLREAYYILEWVTRILLRERLGLDGLWPPQPDPSAFRSPLREEITKAWNAPPIVHLDVVQHAEGDVGQAPDG